MPVPRCAVGDCSLPTGDGIPLPDSRSADGLGVAEKWERLAARDVDALPGCLLALAIGACFSHRWSAILRDEGAS
jgi:hypothetical protein